MTSLLYSVLHTKPDDAKSKTIYGVTCKAKPENDNDKWQRSRSGK